MITDKLVLKMIKEKEYKDKLYLNNNEKYYMNIYFNKKKWGINKMVVSEWDLFEKQVAEDKIKKAIKNIESEDLSDMSKRKVEIRLSKAYNVASVEVSEIETVEEFYAEREWAKLECETIINSMPDDGYKTKVANTPVQAVASFQNQGYNNNAPKTQSTSGYAFGTEKQHKIVKDSRNTQKILNAGIDPNNIQDYATLQRAIKAVFGN